MPEGIQHIREIGLDVSARGARKHRRDRVGFHVELGDWNGNSTIDVQSLASQSIHSAGLRKSPSLLKGENGSVGSRTVTSIEVPANDPAAAKAHWRSSMAWLCAPCLKVLVMGMR